MPADPEDPRSLAVSQPEARSGIFHLQRFGQLGIEISNEMEEGLLWTFASPNPTTASESRTPCGPRTFWKVTSSYQRITNQESIFSGSASRSLHRRARVAKSSSIHSSG